MRVIYWNCGKQIQKIASRVWKAISDKLFGDGEHVHFKKYGTLSSLEGKANRTGIRYNIENNLFLWNGLEIPVMLNVNNQYEIDALMSKICYCRIKRIFVKDRYKYIIQLVLGGVPPIKVIKTTGKIKNSVGGGTTGIDMGTQTIAYVNDYDVKLLELAPRVQSIEDEKRRVQRDMYSAYLIKNVNEDLSSINNEQCTIDFDKFLKLHNKEVQRLQGQENLISMGI